MKKGFSQSRAAASLLAHGRSRPSQPPAMPRALPRPSPAQRRAWPASTPRRARPRQSSPAAWRPCAVDAAACRSRPAPAPMRPPTPAEAGALACSLPRCLSSRKHRAPPLFPSPRHCTRWPNPPHLLHLGQRPCARSSASLSDMSCSRLCRLIELR